MNQYFGRNYNGQIPGVNPVLQIDGLGSQAGMSPDQRVDHRGVNKRPFLDHRAMSQVCSAYRIEFKIVILSIFFGVDKKFDTAVFVGRAVGGGALRQDVFFPDVENDPNLIFYMANPKLY